MDKNITMLYIIVSIYHIQYPVIMRKNIVK